MKLKSHLRHVHSAPNLSGHMKESFHIPKQSTSEQALNGLIESSMENAKLTSNDNLTSLLTAVGDSEMIEFTIECVGDVCEMFFKSKYTCETSDDNNNNSTSTVKSLLSRICIRLFVAVCTHKLTDIVIEPVFKT